MLCLCFLHVYVYIYIRMVSRVAYLLYVHVGACVRTHACLSKVRFVLASEYNITRAAARPEVHQQLPSMGLTVVVIRFMTLKLT